MYEINLVPDVKGEMIRALKLRNLVFFVCLVAVAAAGVVLLILGGVKGGQDIAMASQDGKLKELSVTINSYDDLDELLTMQDQLNKISEIGQNKRVLSRVFNVLSTLLPSGADTISLSELSINLDESTLNFEAQADAGEDPLIDYRVLEAFKKSMPLMRYDYGRYVDENGNAIPTMCIKETDDAGNVYSENGSIYAIWTKNVKGCNPSANDATESLELKTTDDGEEETEETEEEVVVDENRIYRTPQYNNWYKKGYMTLSGEISGVAHFDSQCITYSGIEDGSSVKWTQENACQLVPDGGIIISDSSNGRDASDNLVLRFTATISIDPMVFAFQNKHVMAIAPTGRQNVTDSYVQIEGMFAPRAKDCATGDTSCSNSKNATGE